jgi:adiponectin receptor
MGLSAVFPIIHGLFAFGYRHLNKAIGLSWLVLQGALYILGAAIYAARIPERVWPGRFDIFFASHQIFHVLVIVAAAVHLKGLVNAFHAKHTGPYSSVKVFGGNRVKID